MDPKFLNAALQRSTQYMQTIDDILPNLNNVKVMSPVDIRQAFWTLKLDKGSSMITTFETPFGRYRWLRLAMGLNVSPEIFSSRIQAALSGLKGAYCIAADIFVSRSEAFSVKYLDLYYKYEIPATEGNIDVAHRWHNSHVDFWQTQLNFATWCATTGCGVSVHDHLNGRYDFAPESAQLSKSIFRFHVYYQTRRILHQIRAALPTEEAWNAFNNVYDHTAYQTISNEFGVDPQPRHSDWRTTRGHNGWPTGLALHGPLRSSPSELPEAVGRR